MLLAAVNVQANDYLEQKDHYTVMAKGPGVRMVVPNDGSSHTYYVSKKKEANNGCNEPQKLNTKLLGFITNRWTFWHKDGQNGIKMDKLAEILEQAHFLPLSE